MGRAFVYLTFCSMRNRVRTRLRRLREPRYLIGLIVGVLYLYFAFLRPRPRRVGPGAAGDSVVLAAYRGGLEVVGGVGLFAMMAARWVLPGSSRPALAFSRAEMQFLFPAPITRTQLIHYKIIRSQLGALLGSALMTVFFRPSSLSGLTVFAGTLIVMTTINLHLTGVSLRRQSLAEHGVAGWRRQWAPLAIIAGMAASLAVLLHSGWMALTSAGGPAAVFAELERLGATPLARIALFPFTSLVRLPLSETPVDFLRAVPVALALLAANYVWVIRSDAAFEEASADVATTTATSDSGRSVAPVSARRRSEPFFLRPSGRPEVALLWKNLILVGRYVSLGMLLRTLPVLVVVGILLARATATMADTLAAVCMMTAALTVLVGPQAARNDLRSDLAQIAVLKAWPVSGSAIVRGEVLAPTVLLSAISWLAIVGAISLSTGPPFQEALAALDRLSYAAAAMVLAPGLILVQVVVHNGLAVIFPAWVEVGASRQRGVDVMGQRLLTTVALLIVVALAFLPAALVAGAVGWGLYAITGSVPVLAPAIVATCMLGVESLVAIEAIGAVLDRTDMSAVAAAE